MKTVNRNCSYKSTLSLVLSLIGLASTASAVTVFEDTYTSGGVERSEDIDINVPGRQSAGTVSSRSVSSKGNDVAGMMIAIASQSEALSPESDALFLRTQTDPSASVISWSAVCPTVDFAPWISGTQWSGSYDARVTLEKPIRDTFLGFGLNSVSGTPSPSDADFFFAMRPSGIWLLWRNNGADFETGTLSDFTDQQQYSVHFKVDETSGKPLLSVTVTPLGGTPQTVATSLPLTIAGAMRNFGFTSSVVSDGTEGFTDAWIDNLTIANEPAPATNLVRNGDFTANAAAFKTSPGALGGGNPGAIPDWTPVIGGTVGLNGAAVGFPKSPFGPADTGGRTYAFIQSGDAGLQQKLALVPNTTYHLSFDVGARDGNESATFRVQIADGDGVMVGSGDLNASSTAFTTQSYTFTSPNVIMGNPSITLYNLTAGDNTVDFANVKLVANRPPVASDITLPATSGRSATLRLLGGKNPPTDPDGDRLLVSGVNYIGDRGGEVATNGTDITYTAADTYTGSDAVNYTVSDGYGGTNTKTLAVTVAAPAATPQIRDTLPDVWPATDALGRTLPLHRETGGRRTDKFAGIFYFNWQASFPNTTVYDNSKLIAANPKNPAWGVPGTPHYWGEPRFGYYRPNDPWIIRKHAQMLVDAGVDVIIFDMTNGETYDSEREALCTEFEKIREEGGRTPQIAFMAFANYAKTVAHLWKTFYQPSKHQALWFQWKGKPLLLTPPEALETDELKNFFTTRTSWAWTRGGPTSWFGDGRDKWPWLDTAPQGFGWHDSLVKAEAVPVGVAQHATSNIGRSFHEGSQPPPAEQRPEQGLYFAEQWHHALLLKPEFIFITGWNEWIAGRFLSDGTSQFLGRVLPAGETFFVDAYNQEYNRDIEPMRGGHTDNYYWQMADGIRRFKGARPVPVASAAKTIAIPGDFAQWADLRPEYLDDLHDTTPRDHAGVADAPHYTNRTGRNDLDTMHVAHDTTHLYFHAAARDVLTPSNDEHWMVLFLDTDRDAKTGWLGYDFRINQARTTDTSSIERWDGAAWQAVAPAKWETRDRDLHLAVPRATLELTAASTALQFDFKWADNLPESPDALDFLDQGDTAPNARFNYRYTPPQP